MAEIRHARHSDAKALVDMAERFHLATLPEIAFGRNDAARTVRHVLDTPGCLCLVLDDDGPKGAIVMQSMKYALGPAVLVKEIVFWIEPAFRGKWWRKMLAAAETWAASIGASEIGMSCFNDGRTVKLFERQGYEPREIVSTKRI